MSKRYLGVSVLLLILALLLISLPVYNLWWVEAFNSGHTILFLLFTCLLFLQLKNRYHPLKTSMLYLSVFILAALAGVLIEVLQSLVHREPSVSDLISDLYGILAALCLAALFNINEKKGFGLWRSFFLSSALVFFLLGVAPLLQLSWHYVARDRAFPIVLDFDESWSSSFVRYNNSRLLDVSNRLASARNGLHLIQFDAGQYPGVALIESEPDWTKYSKLRFKILSGSASDIEIILRVHDKEHNQLLDDRYNEVLLVRPGLNKYDISLAKIMRGPMGRKLDMSQVSGLILFAVKLEEPVQLAMSNLTLE